MKNKNIVIIGGVAGGASAAARLRRLDEQSNIILIEKGEYISFANCGLPYYIGGTIKSKSALLVQTVEAFRNRYNIDIRILCEATYIDREKKTVAIVDKKNNASYELPYDKLVLAPGAKPFVPFKDLPEGAFTIRNIPDTYAIDEYINTNNIKRAAVIGAGFIGLEMAENLHDRGLSVSVIEADTHILPPMDIEMAAIVKSQLEEKGIKLFCSSAVTDIIRKNKKLHILTKVDDIETDMVIVSIGVRPEISLAKSAGLEIGQTGGILVDEYLRTSDPNIYAVGDATEKYDYISSDKTLLALAGPANRQGRTAANNIAGLKEAFPGVQGTAVIKIFDMVAAQTGQNEKQLKKASIDYEKIFVSGSSHAGYYPDAKPIWLKLIFSKNDGRILGAQAVGYEGVDKRIDIIATAMKFKATVYDIMHLELCYAPPFGSAKDIVNIAGFAAANVLNGNTNVFHYNEVPELVNNNEYILDCRTPLEYSEGHIDKAVSIPLDSIRDRIDEIPKDRPIYVYCKVGLRGYVVTRILAENGYKNLYNLSGGYDLVKMANK